MNQVITREAAPMAPAALAAMATALLAGRQEFYNTERSALTVALLAGLKDSDALLDACRDDVTTEFGVEPTEFGILAYTPRMVVVGFHARTVAGGQAMTPYMWQQQRERDWAAAQRQAAAAQRTFQRFETGVALDPVWAIWPWGIKGSDDNYTRENWGLGVASMLNQAWGRAIELLQHAVGQCIYLHPREQFWVRRSLAANIRLAIRYSHGEAV